MRASYARQAELDSLAIHQMTKKVLVCGGREYSDAAFLFAILDLLHEQLTFVELIHGAAPGADSLSGDWARQRGVKETPVPANWKKQGKAAGAIRNALMLTFGPDLVISFPGGKGTADMVKRAKRAGVPVINAGENAIFAFFEPETGDEIGKDQGESSEVAREGEDES